MLNSTEHETSTAHTRKVEKTARIRNRYNQVPNLSQDTKWESNKITINITNESQEVSLFPSCDHKAAMNRSESMANTRNKLHKCSTKVVPPWNSKNILLEFLNQFHGAPTYVDQSKKEGKVFHITNGFMQVIMSVPCCIMYDRYLQKNFSFTFV